MPPWSTASSCRPRQPLAWVAVAAVAGVGLAELWRVSSPTHGRDDGTAVGVVASLFAACVAGWWNERRQNPGRGAWFFWGAVVAAYAGLHLLNSEPVAASALARRLSSPVVAADTEAREAPPMATVTGAVFDLPRQSPGIGGGNNWRFVARLDTLALDGGTPARSCHAPVLVQWRDGPRALAVGDRLELSASIVNLRPPRNPGEFDEEALWRRRGIFSELRLQGVADGLVLPITEPPVAGGAAALRPAVLRAARTCHDWMSARLSDDLRGDPDVCAVVSTALLGLRDRPGLGPLEPAFQRTGTLHYFAIDGLKLGLVAWLLLRLLTFLGVPRPWPGVLVLPLLFGYALATGLGAASARAVLVAAALLGGEVLDRPIRPLNSLGAAAALLLLLDTQQLFALSFQLTFLVVLAILLVARPVDAWLVRFGAPDPFLPRDLYSRPLRAWEWLRRGTFGLTAVALAAWLGSLPLSYFYFHLVSPISPVANVVVFPLAFAVLSLGVLSLFGSLISRTLGIWVNNTNWLAAKALLFLVHAFDAVPGGSFVAAAPEHWHYRQPPTAELTVFDLGHARAACLVSPGGAWLLDAARPWEYTQTVRACLEAQAIRRLDGLLLTQGDADHLAGARLALADFSPAQVVEPALLTGSVTFRELRAQLVAAGHTETRCQRGDRFALMPHVDAEVLYPPGNLPKAVRTARDRALALRLTAAGWHVLVLPETTGPMCDWLLAHASPAELASDVLVAAGTDVPDTLRRMVRPRLVVLKTPTQKQLAPPTDPSPLPAAPDTSVEPIFRQTHSGAVTLRFYPGRLEANGFVDGRKVVVQPPHAPP